MAAKVKTKKTAAKVEKKAPAKAEAKTKAPAKAGKEPVVDKAIAKKILKGSIKYELRQVARGEEGHDFFLSTFRFPAKRAQAFERRCLAAGVSMSSALNHLVESFNAGTPDPGKTVKADRTLKVTDMSKRNSGEGTPAKAKAEKPAKKAPAKAEKDEEAKSAKKSGAALTGLLKKAKAAAKKGKPAPKARKLKVVEEDEGEEE